MVTRQPLYSSHHISFHQEGGPSHKLPNLLRGLYKCFLQIGFHLIFDPREAGRQGKRLIEAKGHDQGHTTSKKQNQDLNLSLSEGYLPLLTPTRVAPREEKLT